MSFDRLACGSLRVHGEHEWPKEKPRQWCAGVEARVRDNNEPALTVEDALERSDHLCGVDYAYEPVVLRQFTMVVPEYEWMTNSATIVRLAEDAAAKNGLVLGTQMPTVEAENPGQVALCWLTRQVEGGASAAYEHLFRLREKEQRDEQRSFTYWVVEPTWDAMEPDVREHFRDFVYMVARHEGHLVMGGITEVREMMGSIPVVGLRLPIAHKRSMTDIMSSLL